MAPEDTSEAESHSETPPSQIPGQSPHSSLTETPVEQRTPGLDLAAAALQESSNARQPLLKMPQEVLLMIMTFIPHMFSPETMGEYRRAWHVSVYQTTMLMPISQTCRRLRAVAVGCPSLWTSLAYWSRPQSQIFAERSRDLPLTAFLPNPAFVERQELTDIAEGLLRRTRELDIGDLSPWTVPLDRLFSLPMPTLEVLSVQFVSSATSDEEGKHLVELPLARERLPRLRRLYLCACTLASHEIFSSLTHLALHVLIIPRVHELLQSILPACYALESLHLEEFEDQEDLSSPPDQYRQLPTPPVLASLGRLRRLALLGLYDRLASFVFSMVLANQQPLVVQLHDIYMDSGISTFPQHRILDEVSQVIIGRYPQHYRRNIANNFVWGLTATGAQRTLRMVGETSGEVIGVLRQRGLAVLAGVRELWLADISKPVYPPNVLSDPDAASLRALIQDMSALETVTLLNQFQTDWARAPPSLCLLPTVHGIDTTSQSQPRPKTLRIAYGYGPSVLYRWSTRPLSTPAAPLLDLTCILEELASGAYSYILHIVIETPYRVDVDAGDVERLREYVDTVEIRFAEETPTIVLPAYCNEPAAWPSNDPWPYKLW